MEPTSLPHSSIDGALHTVYITEPCLDKSPDCLRSCSRHRSRLIGVSDLIEISRHSGTRPLRAHRAPCMKTQPARHAHNLDTSCPSDENATSTSCAQLEHLMYTKPRAKSSHESKRIVYIGRNESLYPDEIVQQDPTPFIAGHCTCQSTLVRRRRKARGAASNASARPNPADGGRPTDVQSQPSPASL